MLVKIFQMLLTFSRFKMNITAS